MTELKQKLHKLEKTNEGLLKTLKFLREDIASAKENVKNAGDNETFKSLYLRQAQDAKKEEEETFLEYNTNLETIKKLKRSIRLDEEIEAEKANILAKSNSSKGDKSKAQIQSVSTSENTHTIAIKSFDIDNNKSRKRFVQIQDPNKIKNKDSEYAYSVEKDVSLFLMGLKNNDMRKYNDFREVNKGINIHTFYDTQDTAASDLAGNAPGYHLEAGDTAIHSPLAPPVLIAMIEENIYNGSAAIWLTGGLKTAVQDSLKYLFDEVEGPDWTAEAELKPELKAAIRSVRIHFKKIAGRIQYTEEMIRFEKITMALIEDFAQRFARSVYKKLDFSFINGQGGDSIIGLADTTIRGKASTSQFGGDYVKPATFISTNVDDLRRAFVQVDYDIVNSGSNARAVFDPEYVDKMFVLDDTTGGKDLVKAKDLGFGLVGYKGFTIRKNTNMFRNKANNGVVGVIDLGGTSIYSDRQNPFSFLTDPYTLSDRNVYRVIGDGFFDVVVEKGSQTILVLDTFTGFASNIASANSSTITAKIQTSNGGSVAANTKIRAINVDNGAVLGEATVASDGTLTIALATAAPGLNFRLVDEQNTVVGTGVMSNTPKA